LALPTLNSTDVVVLRMPVAESIQFLPGWRKRTGIGSSLLPLPV
jgi:hypothetical protein